jgi:hypothetical protein
MPIQGKTVIFTISDFKLSPNSIKQKIPSVLTWDFLLAEKEGFEPPDLLQSTVFKTAAFDRSAISPLQK